MKAKHLTFLMFTICTGTITSAAGPYNIGDSQLQFTDIYSRGEIAGNDAAFDNGTDTPGTTIYKTGFLLYDGTNAVWADSGFTNHTTQIVDGTFGTTTYAVNNSGMTFPGITGLDANLEFQTGSTSATQSHAYWNWQFFNGTGSDIDFTFSWFLDVDDTVAGSTYNDDIIVYTDTLSGSSYFIQNYDGYAIAMGNGTADSSVDLTQSVIMDWTGPQYTWYGISDSLGSSYFWSSENNFVSTGPEGSGEYAVASAIANTMQNDTDGNLISDTGNDVAAAVSFDFSINAGFSSNVSLYCYWGEAGTAVAGTVPSNVENWNLY